MQGAQAHCGYLCQRAIPQWGKRRLITSVYLQIHCLNCWPSCSTALFRRKPHIVFEMYLMRLPYTSYDLGWFACFRIQFLSDHIMIHSCLVWLLWWLRHGAIGPSEATSFVGVNVDWLEFWIDTFELVIHLSKVQQSALRLFSLLESPAIPAVPEIPVTCSFMWCCAKLLKPPFLLQPQLLKVQHDMCESRQQACPFPAGVVFLVSGEVIHFVHLIRWNLKAVLCLGGWLEHGPVVAQLHEP